MPIPIQVIQKLILVINCLLNENVPLLYDVIINSYFHDNALQQLQDILTRRGRYDILEILHQTMTGNYSLLEMNERHLLHILDQFHANRNREAREWPAWCYLFTQNNNPVQQEMSGRYGYTENGNIISIETEDGARADPVPKDRQFTLPPLQEEVSMFSQPSVALQNLPPEQPREPPQCCICGKNMQAIRPSNPVWSRISDIIKDLSPEQLQDFISEINSYGRGILNPILSQVTLSHEMVDAFIVPPLRRCRLSGRKCVLCQLTSVFQRVGRRDLANQVEAIQHSLG